MRIHQQQRHHHHNHHHHHHHLHTHSALALLEEEMARITAVHINDKEAACAALRQLLEREVQEVQEAHDARAQAPQQQPVVVGPMPPSGHGLSNMLNQKTAKLLVCGGMWVVWVGVLWGYVGCGWVGVQVWSMWVCPHKHTQYKQW